MKVAAAVGFDSHCSVLENYKRNNTRPVTFKGTPEYLNLTNDNIENYDRLSNGSYLDIHDDAFAPKNKDIRNHNLSFLDEIILTKDKRAFMEHYKKVTKFPDLRAVSLNIENEFVRSLRAVTGEFNDYKYDVIAAGYDGTCSVGKGMALPGSDLDKAFVILRGDAAKIWGEGKDEEIVANFKNRLWFLTDQRVLSYNHDTSFPTIMTINQVKDYIERLNGVTKSVKLDPDRMSRNVREEYLDLIRASEFNINVAGLLPKRKYDDSLHALNKENVKNFAYFIESVRDGKKLITSQIFEELVKQIENSDFYRFSNVAQMQAMKNAVSSGREQKNKIILRQTLKEDFNSWNTAKQFEFIKTLIKYSCEDESDFMQYFSNDRNIREKYKPLLGLLCYGDSEKRLNPRFDISTDHIDIYLKESEKTPLFQGFNRGVMWIESQKRSVIEDVLLHVDKLRKTELFKFLSKVQAPIPYFSDIPDNFGIIGYFTKNGRRIIERTLR